MENLDPALLASLDPRALEQLLQSMAASMPKTEQLCKGFTPSEDLKKKEAAMHESKKAYDNQLSEVMKTLSKLQAVPDRQREPEAAAARDREAHHRPVQRRQKAPRMIASAFSCQEGGRPLLTGPAHAATGCPAAHHRLISCTTPASKLTPTNTGINNRISRSRPGLSARSL